MRFGGKSVRKTKRLSVCVYVACCIVTMYVFLCACVF